jgi:hypothetical protein
MIYKYLILIAYLFICNAAEITDVSYVYTVHQGSFDVEGKSECHLFAKASLATIKTNSPGASCTSSGSNAHCVFNNPVECTNVAAACKGNLVGGKCGTQKVEVQQCCYGIIDFHGTGIKEAQGSCPAGCIGLKGFGTTYHGCKTCGCYHGRSVSGSDC